MPDSEPLWLLVERLPTALSCRVGFEGTFVRATHVRDGARDTRIVLLDHSGEELEVPLLAVAPANPSIQDEVEDIGALSHLNEASMYHLIATRYARRHVYTRAGSVLVAVNPFAPMADLYSQQALETYRRASSPANWLHMLPTCDAFAASRQFQQRKYPTTRNTPSLRVQRRLQLHAGAPIAHC